MRIGIFALLTSPRATPELLRELGQACEEQAIDSLWVGEHVVLFDEYTSKYPGPTDKLMIPRGEGLLDPKVALTYIAAVTSKLRLGTAVCLLPQDNPLYVAKEYATLDMLSHGRLDFGVGVGWSAQEYSACGSGTFGERGARCDEYLQAVKSLWYDQVSTFHGRYIEFEDCLMFPKPIQVPHVPLYVGGSGDQALLRAARYGDGWVGVNLRPEEAAIKVSRLYELLSEANRRSDLFRIVLAATDPIMAPEDVPSYHEAGVDELVVPFSRLSRRRLAENLEEVCAFVTAARALRV